MKFFSVFKIAVVLHVCLGSPSLWAKSDICKGRWAYNKYKSCIHSEFGIKSYVVKRSESCGVEQYKQWRSEVCGVESWNHGNGEPCGLETDIFGKPCQVAGLFLAGFMSAIPSAILPTCSGRKYNSCHHPSFGVQQYNLCRHQIFGIDAYKECAHPDHGTEWNAGIGAVCGTESEILFSERGLDKESVSMGVLTLVNQETSACTTCDDLPRDTESEVKTLFKCLKASIENAEEGKSGYSLPDLKIAVKAIKDLHATTSCYLSDDNVQHVADVINNYPSF